MKNKVKPKTKTELRQAIIENINAIKLSVPLQKIYVITDVIRRSCDKKEYISLTDDESNIVSLFNTITSGIDSENLKRIKCMVYAIVYGDHMRK